MPSRNRAGVDEGPGDEAESVYGIADHRCFEGARAGCEDSATLPKHGISEPTFYNWKSELGGMDMSEACRAPPSVEPESIWIR